MCPSIIYYSRELIKHHGTGNWCLIKRIVSISQTLLVVGFKIESAPNNSTAVNVINYDCYCEFDVSFCVDGCTKHKHMLTGKCHRGNCEGYYLTNAFVAAVLYAYIFHYELNLT